MKYDRDELVKMIALHEGIVLNVYQDHLGINTVGIGRNLEDRGITDGELLFINKTMEDVYEIGNIGPEENIERIAPMYSVSVGDVVEDENGIKSVVSRVGFRTL